MVFEIQPRLDWDKGKAVLYLRDPLELRAGEGIGIFVGHASDPDVGGRTTAAAFVLDVIEEVERSALGPADLWPSFEIRRPH